MGRPRKQTMPEETKVSESQIREIFNYLSRLEDEIKKIKRQQEIQTKSIDILDRDMDGFDEVAKKVQQLIEKFGTFEFILKSHTKDQSNAVKDLSAETQEIKVTASEIIDKFEGVVSTEFDQVIEVIKQKKTALKTPSFWSKLFSRRQPRG